MKESVIPIRPPRTLWRTFTLTLSIVLTIGLLGGINYSVYASRTAKDARDDLKNNHGGILRRSEITQANEYLQEVVGYQTLAFLLLVPLTPSGWWMLKLITRRIIISKKEYPDPTKA